jgi:hypothetical protein
MAGFLTSPRRRAIWQFYVDLPYQGPAGATALGVLVASQDLALGALALGPGLAALGGVTTVWAQRPSLEQIDAWFAEDLGRIIEQGRHRLDPDGDRLRGSVLHLAGPVEPPPRKTLFLTERARRSTSFGYRSPLNRVVVLFPMERALTVYSCLYDSIRNEVSQVQEVEYNYKDVVGVALAEDTARDGRARPSGRTQTFELRFSNGQTLSVPVAAPLSASGGMTELDKTVASIRTLLRSRQ